MTVETFLANFERLADAPNGIPKLRELILQLAVRGKLVPQDPNDEPASELLKKIEVEKQRLIEDGTTRKPKEPSPVALEDEPYCIPTSWKWVRLAHVGKITGGGTPRTSNPSNFAENGIPWLTPADMRGLTGKFIARGGRDLSETGLQNSSATLMPPGTVVFSSRAPIGYVAIATNEISTNQGFKSVVPYTDEMSKYIHCFLSSAAAEIDRNATGTTFREISGKKMAAVLMPLPPLAEQKHIAVKVDELMALCDELEAKQQKKRTTRIALNRACLHALASPDGEGQTKVWRRLRDHFNDLYTVPETVAELRQTILQLAVIGRLVPQDPADEPASELIKRIQAEKQRLIAEGKIRKPKPLPPIDPDKTPYDLPRGWVWARLGNLGITQTGTTPRKSESSFYGGNCPFVKPANISPRGNVSYDGEQLTEDGARNGRMIMAGSALMVCIGGSIGKVGFIDRDCSCNQQINALTPLGNVEGWFAAHLMQTPMVQEQVLSTAPQTTLPILNKGKWERLIIPVPPLSEQRRIVKKVDQLMSLCDDLEAKLQQAQTDADNLLTAIVQELVSSQGSTGKTCR